MNPFIQTRPPATAPPLDTLFDIVVAGGPLMIPLGFCSVVGLAYIVERAIRMRRGKLGTTRLGEELAAAVSEGDVSRGLEVCERSRTPLARILATRLTHATRPFLEMEKAVEDAGSREVKALTTSLRVLTVIAMIAPLLGLLGTIFGMIQAFINVALRQGLGKPELLASGIAQALITTAAGLTIAIPVQAAYFYFRARIDRFSREAETAYDRLSAALDPAKLAALDAGRVPA
jgi:biopolymer transport protein ExbB